MKGVEFEVLENPAIYVARLTSEYEWSPGLEITTEMRNFLDSVDNPHYFIMDLTEINITLSDITQITNVSARGETLDVKLEEEQVPLFKHPNIRKLVMVTQKPLYKLAIKGLKTSVFGSVDVSIADTYEDALVFCQ